MVNSEFNINVNYQKNPLDSPLVKKEKEKSSEVHSVAKILHKGDSSSSAIKIQTPVSPPVAISLSHNQILRDKILSLLSKKPNEEEQRLATKQRNDPLGELFHIGLKGNLSEEIANLESDYGRTYFIHYAYERIKNALAFLEQLNNSDSFGDKTKEEIQGLINICQHRLIIFNYALRLDRIENKTEEELNGLVAEIRANIDLLDRADSEKVVSSEDGSAFFAIPGGSATHYVSYEFRKKAGTPPLYFFVIHNRGEKDGGENIHGSFSFKIDGKEYQRTSVPIQISKEALKNPEFIKALIKGGGEPLVPYHAIKSHLLDKGGKIIEGEEEKIIKKLQYMLANPTLFSLTEEDILKIEKNINGLVKESENIHSTQILETCTESNQTELEKKLSSSSIRKELKLFTLQNITDQVVAKIRNTPPINIETEKPTIVYKAGILSKDYNAYVIDSEIIGRHVQGKQIELKKKLARTEVPPNLEFFKRSSKALMNTLLPKLSLTSITPSVITNIKESEFDTFLETLPTGFEGNKELMIKLIKHTLSPIKKELLLKLASEILKKDKDVFFAAVEQKSEFFNYFSPKLKKDKAFLLEAVKVNGNILEFVSNELKDEELFLAALEEDAYSFKYVPAELKNNKAFILSAVSVNGAVFLQIPENLKNDKEFLLEILKHNRYAFEFFPSKFKDDKHVVSAAALRDPDNLQFASERIRGQINFMLPLIKKNGLLLKYASDELKNNRKVVLAAIRQNPEALEFASDVLKASLESEIET